MHKEQVIAEFKAVLPKIKGLTLDSDQQEALDIIKDLSDEYQDFDSIINDEILFDMLEVLLDNIERMLKVKEKKTKVKAPSKKAIPKKSSGATKAKYQKGSWVKNKRSVMVGKVEEVKTDLPEAEYKVLYLDGLPVWTGEASLVKAAAPKHPKLLSSLHQLVDDLKV